MKKYLVVIGALLVLLLSACGGMAQNEPDPVTVVQEFYTAIAEKQLETAMSHVADDALFINPTGTFTGKDEVRENISALIDGGFVFELRDLVNTNGKVNYGYTLYIGGEAVEEGDNGVTIVKDGKVVFDGLEEGIPAALR
ncbi:nuclear transport factor 2 family protein [Promineifilum sp.]|uniref:nuclear transport factor 2 family protein n=1 Tax=Promineifilum sp. TaxID=2664178 RepID=UPI0035AD9CB4